VPEGFNFHIINNTMATLTSASFKSDTLASIFDKALKEGKIDAMSLMNQAEKDITLNNAIMRNDIVTAKYLLSNGTVFANDVMYEAAGDKRINSETFKFLCDEGAPLNSFKSNTVLHQAVRCNDPNKVKMLFGRDGVKDMINKTNSHNNTPLNSGLHANERQMNKDIIRQLMINNACLDVRSSSTEVTPRELLVKYFGDEFCENKSKEEQALEDLNTKLADAQTEIANLKAQLADAQAITIKTDSQDLQKAIDNTNKLLQVAIKHSDCLIENAKLKIELENAQQQLCDTKTQLAHAAAQHEQLMDAQTKITDFKIRLEHAFAQELVLVKQLEDAHKNSTTMNEKYAAMKTRLLSIQTAINDVPNK